MTDSEKIMLTVISLLHSMAATTREMAFSLGAAIVYARLADIFRPNFLTFFKSVKISCEWMSAILIKV